MNRRRSVEKNRKNINRGFVLPMVSINYKELPRNFVNSYIRIDDQNRYAMLVFDKTDNYDYIFLAFMNRVIENNANYVSHEENEDELIITFKIPTFYREDFELFLKGKYSCFSDQYKDRLFRFFGKKGLGDNTHEVNEYDIIRPSFAKRKRLADYLEVDVNMIEEVFSSPDIEKELYTPIELIIANNTNINT